MNTVYLKELPVCQGCGERHAQFDTKTKAGPPYFGAHGYLCHRCHQAHGAEPTTRLAKLVKVEPAHMPKSDKVYIKMTRSLVYDGIAKVKCPACKHPRLVEPDANYRVECEACGFDYQVISPF